MNYYIIILNGEKPEKLSADFFYGKKIICADGAYDFAAKAGIKADYIIGDLDSAKSSSFSAPLIRHKKDKDSTDGQLCLDFAVENGAEFIELIGASGGRDDHYLGNITLLYRALRRGVNAKIHTDYNDIFMFEGRFEHACTKNKYFSIVPFAGNLHIINTEGLKYKVTDRILYLHETVGISNETISDKVEIDVKSGTGIAVYTFEDVK